MSGVARRRTVSQSGVANYCGAAVANCLTLSGSQPSVTKLCATSLFYFYFILFYYHLWQPRVCVCVLLMVAFVEQANVSLFRH